MAMQQVGVIALRAPSGEFLPSVPIFKETQTPKNKISHAISEDELVSLFVERIKKYKSGNKSEVER